jgi:hypothetical protein
MTAGYPHRYNEYSEQGRCGVDLLRSAGAFLPALAVVMVAAPAIPAITGSINRR